MYDVCIMVYALEEVELSVWTQWLDVDAGRVGERATKTVNDLVRGEVVHFDLFAGPLRVEWRHEWPVGSLQPASGVGRRVKRVLAGRQPLRFRRSVAVRRVAHAHRAVL